LFVAPACAGRSAGHPGTAQPNRQSTVAWSIFVDDLHMDFRNTGFLRRALSTITNELIKEGDLYAMTSSGPSSIAVPLTGDRSVLPGTIRKFTGNALRPDNVLRDASDKYTLGELRQRATIALSEAQKALDQLARDRQHARKAFVYITNGYFVESEHAQSIGVICSEGCTPRPVTIAPYRKLRAQLAATARRARVTVFVIDARVLPPSSIDLDQPLDGWESYWAITQRSLEPLVAQTRGIALLKREDLRDGYRRINAAMGRPTLRPN
jgi:hypothetical protein